MGSSAVNGAPSMHSQFRDIYESEGINMQSIGPRHVRPGVQVLTPAVEDLYAVILTICNVDPSLVRRRRHRMRQPKLAGPAAWLAP